MKKTFFWILLPALLLLASCKSNFEKIRSSNDGELVLKKAFEYYEEKEYFKAQTLFELVLSQIRGREEAEKAHFQYAYCHYYLKEYLLAAYYFKNFSNTFTSSLSREEASFMSAFSNYQLSPNYKLEQGNTIKAVEEFQTFTNLFPESKRVEECNKLIDECRRKLEEKAFAEGQLYFNLRQYQSATISFDNLLKEYPESPDAERVRYLIAKSGHLLAENSILEKKEERYTDSVRRCDEFLAKYPTGKFSKEIKQIKKDSEREVKEVKKLLKDSKA